VRAYPEPSECTKTVGGRGFAPDPTGGAYSAPPDPLAGFRGRRFAAQGRRFATREGKGQVGEGGEREGREGEGEGEGGEEGEGEGGGWPPHSENRAGAVGPWCNQQRPLLTYCARLENAFMATNDENTHRTSNIFFYFQQLCYRLASSLN
jgi:hypothetical protein